MKLHFACVLSCVVSLGANLRMVSATPPPTAKRSVTDVYHGQELVDDFRWLENWDDPEVKRWSDAQNVNARGFLDALPAVEAIRSRLTELETARSVEYTSLVLRDGAVFALKHEPPKQQPLVVVLHSVDDTDGERVSVDPNALDSTGGTSIDWFVPSLDGKHLAVSQIRLVKQAGQLERPRAPRAGRPTNRMANS
ncbi:MAG TPA: hypothetical protein VGX76_03705 [Pirellulales bacterium]|jgi:prolyl oligopeptidase|nr:hypothetical protein [Pirellulales bacterium]